MTKNYVDNIVFFQESYIDFVQSCFRTGDTIFLGHLPDGTAVSSNFVTHSGFYRIKNATMNLEKNRLVADVERVFAYDLYAGIDLNEAMAVLKKFGFKMATFDFIHTPNYKWDKASHNECKLVAWHEYTGMLVSADTINEKTRFNTFDITMPVFFDFESFKEEQRDYFGVFAYSGLNVAIDTEHAKCKEFLHEMIPILKHNKYGNGYETDFSYWNYTQHSNDESWEERKKKLFLSLPAELVAFLKKHHCSDMKGVI